MRQPQCVQQPDVIPHPTGFALAVGPACRRDRRFAIALARFDQRAVSALRGASVPHRAAGKEAAHPAPTLSQVNNNAFRFVTRATCALFAQSYCFIWAPGCQSRRDAQSRFK